MTADDQRRTASPETAEAIRARRYREQRDAHRRQTIYLLVGLVLLAAALAIALDGSGALGSFAGP